MDSFTRYFYSGGGFAAMVGDLVRIGRRYGISDQSESQTEHVRTEGGEKDEETKTPERKE